MPTNFNPVAWLRAMAALPETLRRIESKINSMAKKDEILAAIAAEREQYLVKIEEVLSKQGISDADAAEIIAAIKGIVPDSGPAEGKKNVTSGFIAEGDEYFSVQLNNRNVSEERAALLKGMHEGAVLAGNSQAPGGATFTSTVYFDDGGGRVSQTYTNGKQKAAYDVVVLESLIAEAKGQLL